MSMTEFQERVGTAVRPSRGFGGAPASGSMDAPPPNATGGEGAARRWGANDKTFWGVAATFDELPAGVYRTAMTNTGPVLVKQRVETDNLLELPDDEASKIIAEFTEFWKLEREFRKRGFLCKRGFLLWGPPGSGKTSCLQLLVRRLGEELNGVSLIIEHPETAAAGLQVLRNIEPARPLIAVMEDLDALIQRYGENQYLALLDGEAQVDNIVYVATTNYPEQLDRRFVDRPSRFDTIRYVGMPSAAARRRYLEVKEPDLSPSELTEWVRLSDGFSIAHMKEMIIAVRCFGQPLHDVVERLEAMHARKPTSVDAPDRPSFGFSRSRSEAA